MVDILFLGLSHWHVPMHVAAARRLGLAVAGWDPGADVARAWSAREGGTTVSSLGEALAAGPLLAVVTGSPLEMPDRVVAATRARIPVLVEKPVAPDATTLGALLNEVSALGAWVAVALPYHAGPLVGREGGPVRHLSVRLVNGRPGRYRDWGSPWVLDPAIAGGGALRNLGVHGIDLARLLLGPDLAVAHAQMRRWHGEAIEDHAVVHLCARDGASASIEAGYLHHDDSGSDFEARLVTRDALFIDTGAELLVHERGRAAARLAVTPQSGRYDDLMADVVGRIRGRRPPAATLGDLLGSMRLIDEAYARADQE